MKRFDHIWHIFVNPSESNSQNQNDQKLLFYLVQQSI